MVSNKMSLRQRIRKNMSICAHVEPEADQDCTVKHEGTVTFSLLAQRIVAVTGYDAAGVPTVNYADAWREPVYLNRAEGRFLVVTHLAGAGDLTAGHAAMWTGDYSDGVSPGGTDPNTYNGVPQVRICDAAPGARQPPIGNTDFRPNGNGIQAFPSGGYLQLTGTTTSADAPGLKPLGEAIYAPSSLWNPAAPERYSPASPNALTNGTPQPPSNAYHCLTVTQASPSPLRYECTFPPFPLPRPAYALLTANLSPNAAARAWIKTRAAVSLLTPIPAAVGVRVYLASSGGDRTQLGRATTLPPAQPDLEQCLGTIVQLPNIVQFNPYS